MTRDALRKRLAIWLFLGNGLTFLLFFVCLFAGGLDSPDLEVIVPVVLPLFAVYTSKILSFALRVRPVSPEDFGLVEKPYGMICEGVVALFSLAVPLLIACRALFLIDDTKVLLLVLGLTQTALGAYLGTIFDWLYDTKAPEKTQSVPASQ